MTQIILMVRTPCHLFKSLNNNFGKVAKLILFLWYWVVAYPIAGVYANLDTITITFDINTDKAGLAQGVVQTRGIVDALFSFSQSLGFLPFPAPLVLLPRTCKSWRSTFCVAHAVPCYFPTSFVCASHSRPGDRILALLSSPRLCMCIFLCLWLWFGLICQVAVTVGYGSHQKFLK